MSIALSSLDPRLQYRDPQTIAHLMPKFAWFYEHYFRVQTQGWHHIPSQQPVLFVGSHNGGLASPDLQIGRAHV